MPAPGGAPGIRGPRPAFSTTALSTVTTSSVIEWDVFVLAPGGAADAPIYLATLYEARERSIRVELDGTGSGSFAINRASPECTEAILAQGNLVCVRIPEIHTGYLFAFFLETGDFTLISSDEAGGEMLHFGGRGNLSYLEYGRAWSHSYIAGGQDPKDGVWRAYLAGTGHKPGQILMRVIEEMQDPDRPQHPIPLLIPDFDYDLDSNGDPWTDPDATDEFSYQIGDDGLAIVLRLIPTGVTVQMDPDFTLHAYNTLGRDLTGFAFGYGVVRFERGVNIAIELRRELQPDLVATHILVAGETDHYGTAALSGAATRVTKEAYLAAFGTSTAALNAVGKAELNDRLKQSDTIIFQIANRRTEVDLADPVTVGSVTGPVATAGFYLPGPEGTNGDFWVGDTVRVHTGDGPFDYNEVNARVEAITITRDDDNHELIVIPELKVQPFVCPEATASQTFPALHPVDVFGPKSDAIGCVHYLAPGVGYPEVPAPFHVGKWHFPNYNVPPDGVDYGFGGANNILRIVVIGDGTLTIPTRVDPRFTGLPESLRAILKHRIPLGGISYDETQIADGGSTFVFHISTEGMTHCANWVDIEFNGTTSSIESGYAGDATWVLD